MRRIDAMEDRLHLTLFLRNRGDYQLTAAGKLILAPAEKWMNRRWNWQDA